MTVDVIQSMSDLRQTGSPHEYVVAVVVVDLAVVVDVEVILMEM
jgi:hypothetical protein